MIDDIEVGRYALRTFKLTNTYPRSMPWQQKPELVSVSMAGSHWRDGTCEARCLADSVWLIDPHKAPHESCRCGIYGTLTLAALQRQFVLEASRLVAVFAAEGTTIIGGTGLRTQYARIVAYWADKPYLQTVCAGQFANAQHYDDLNAMLAAYYFPLPPPPPVPKTIFIPLTLDDVKLGGVTWTIPNPEPGTYTRIELEDGAGCSIGPVTLSGPGDTIIVSLQWNESEEVEG